MSVNASHPLSRCGALLMTAIMSGLVCAAPGPVLPFFDATTLPAVAADSDPNPYRNHEARARIVEVGRTVYNQSCAVCHGADATRMGPAPSLRAVGRFCQRITETSLKSRCVADADHYFYKSVMEGKVKLGVTHMPAWRDVLSSEAVWAVRTFLEAPPPAEQKP